MVDLRVISIGTLAAHPLWGEKSPVRTGHATTTLVRVGGRVIVVDPGLPEPAVAARLGERAGVAAGAVTHVFLTSFRVDARRGLGAFPGATLWMSEEERDAMRGALREQRAQAEEMEDAALVARLEGEEALLERIQPAPEKLGEARGASVDLFPLPGVTPGMCGLLVGTSRQATLICGDAVATREHLEQGQVLAPVTDLVRAKESFAEAIEIADVLVPGRDNLIVNPTRGPF